MPLSATTATACLLLALSAGGAQGDDLPPPPIDEPAPRPPKGARKPPPADDLDAPPPASRRRGGDEAPATRPKRRGGDEDAEPPARSRRRGGEEDGEADRSRGGSDDDDDGEGDRPRRRRSADYDDDGVRRGRGGGGGFSFDLDSVGPLSANLIMGPAFMSFPTGMETHLALGLAVSLDVGELGFAELRYQHASTAFSNEALASETGYHTLSPAIAAGLQLGATFVYGLVGISWEIVRVTHTVTTGEAAQWSESGNHLGMLAGAGVRLRLPTDLVPIEARLELDYKRRGPFNDFVFAIFAGVAFDLEGEPR